MLCHNLNSFVVLYLKFCAWFNLKGEVGESLTKHERYFNWYTFTLKISPNLSMLEKFFKHLFCWKKSWHKKGNSSYIVVFPFLTILSWRGVKSHHKFWQKHTFYICIAAHRDWPQQPQHWEEVEERSRKVSGFVSFFTIEDNSFSLFIAFSVQEMQSQQHNHLF